MYCSGKVYFSVFFGYTGIFPNYYIFYYNDTMCDDEIDGALAKERKNKNYIGIPT